MIGQYLSNTNESATVHILQNYVLRVQAYKYVGMHVKFFF